VTADILFNFPVKIIFGIFVVDVAEVYVMPVVAFEKFEICCCAGLDKLNVLVIAFPKSAALNPFNVPVNPNRFVNCVKLVNPE
jgi:hypothetical protein